MRMLKRNATDFEYLPYLGMSDDVLVYDSDDPNAEPETEHTGEFHPLYGDPIACKGNISSPNGYVNQTFYGEEIRYTHTLIMDKSETEISEHGVIRWKGELYDIQAVRPSMNAVNIALKKQTTDGEL